jgi:hypothetical protein
LGATGKHFESLLPQGLQHWLYRLALDRGHHDNFLDRFVVGPVLKLAHALQWVETKWIGGHAAHQSRAPLTAKAGLIQDAEGADV